jgi:hypothetical protein
VTVVAINYIIGISYEALTATTAYLLYVADEPSSSREKRGVTDS